jgi:hypothetical protein
MAALADFKNSLRDVLLGVFSGGILSAVAMVTPFDAARVYIRTACATTAVCPKGCK